MIPAHNDLIIALLAGTCFASLALSMAIPGVTRLSRKVALVRFQRLQSRHHVRWEDHQ